MYRFNEEDNTVERVAGNGNENSIVAKWTIEAHDEFIQVKLTKYGMEKSKKLKRHQIVLSFGYDNETQLLCTTPTSSNNSLSQLFKKSSQLVSMSDPAIAELKCLEQCQILKENSFKQQLLILLAQQNVRIVKYLFCCDAGRMDTKKVKDDPYHYVKEFHRNCDGKQTLVLVQGKDGKVFGGCTDIGWTSGVYDGKTVSVGKRSKNNTFLILSYRNFLQSETIDDDEDAEDEPLFYTKRCRGEQETYHSDTAGPDFADIKIRGPNMEAKLFPDRHYQLRQEDIDRITSSEVRADDKATGIRFFKYQKFEVFEVKFLL